MAIKVADTFISVAADMSAYNKSLKTDGLKSAQSLASQIKSAFRDASSFGGTSKAAGFIADLRLGRSLTESLKTATVGLGSSLKGLSVNALHTGLNGVKSLLGGIKGLFGEIGKGFAIGLGIASFQSLGRVLSDVVGVIPSLVDKGREYLRMVDDIADATGAGSVETSKFTATLLYLGVPLGGVINMIGQASRNLELMGPRLEKLGIKVKDSHHVWLNQIQILDNARHAMSEWGSGSKKVDILAREFGRGGLKSLVDFLNLTDEQFKQITDDAAKMGLIVTEEQRNMAEAAVREGARFQNVWTGLGAQLFTAVGPSIMAFFSSLTETIVANMDAIKLAASQAINFVIGVVSSLLGMSGMLGSFSENIEKQNAVTSPYSASIIDLTDQIGKLDEGTKSATSSGNGQRKAIQGQISAIEKQIAALEKLEKQQDRTYTKAIDALKEQLDAQNALLDAEEKALDQAERDAQLTEDLRQAKIKLFEAQAQLRADTLDPKHDQGTLDQDTLDIAKAQADVLEAQKAITDEAAQRVRDDRRAQLEDVKAFIDDIQQQLEESDNKVKTLADLRKQLGGLEGLQPSLTGQSAADNLLRIEALKTTIIRAQQQIRNDDARADLEAQKARLQEEVSNVGTAARSVTSVKKAELEKQLHDLIEKEKEWSKLSDEEKRKLAGVTDAVNPGLVDAINAARDAGVEFGTKVKGALDNVAKVVGGIIGAFVTMGTIAFGIQSIVLGVFGAIDETAKTLGIDLGKVFDAVADIVGDLVDNLKDVEHWLGLIGAIVNEPGTWWDRLTKGAQDFIDTLPSNKPKPKPTGPAGATGGWLNKPGLFMGAEQGREYVLDHALSEKINSFFSMPTMSGMSAAGGYAPVSIPVYLDGAKVADIVDERLGYRSGRGRR